MIVTHWRCKNSEHIVLFLFFSFFPNDLLSSAHSMQIRIRAKSLKLSVLYCAASRHHCHYVITGNFVIRSFFLYFQKWCFADFSACLWTGKPDAAAVQLLLVPWEHSIKCNAFWQFLSFHPNVVPNSIFSNVPAWGGSNTGWGFGAIALLVTR